MMFAIAGRPRHNKQRHTSYRSRGVYTNTPMEGVEAMATGIHTRKPLAQRFATKWVLNPATGCHEWRSCRGTQRYGSISRGGKRGPILKANRVAWEIAHGPIPDGMCVLHRCDNPPCVNVAHLFLGTHQSNMADRNNKGRQARGAALAATLPSGEAHHMARLTDEQVADVRARYRRGDVTQTALAREYGCARQTIGKLVYWKRRTGGAECR